MALTVIVRSGELTAPASITFDAPRIVIGRGDGCEVLLPDSSVSHRHASIRQRGTDYVLIDEGSTNGTFIGEVRLSPQAPRMLHSGQLLRVGRIWLEVRIEQAAVTNSHKLLTREIALSLVSSALGAHGEPVVPRVRVQKSPEPAADLLLADFEHPYAVGRGVGVELCLRDPDLSRRQLEVIRRGTGIVVRELGSKNGSYLGEQRLEAGKETAWPPDTALHLGQTELVYEDPVRAALLEISRAEDERMREDDPIDPPTGVPSPAASTRPAPERVPAAPGLAEPAGAAPIQQPPKAKASGPRRSGVRVLDLIVALIALTVLGVSLFGLWLLFRA